MERGYEIVVSSKDLEEKKILGIEYPYYKDKYLDIVRIFLENSKRIQQNMQEDTASNKEIFNVYERFPNDMSNIITIVGGRGTGKTTALQEIRTIFMEFGNDRMGVKDEWVERFGMSQRKELRELARQAFRISAMEVIDASALEEQDDLLEIILWHIWEDVKRKSDSNVREEQYGSVEWERQKFLETLDEVYRMHQSMKGRSEGITGGESVLTALENMPNSIKTRNAMHRLLDLYCKIMFPGKEQSTYLVISIDDLDLNVKKSYQMLEEIRRYLLDWRIVILLAVDNKQMEEVCITHFYNEFGVRRNNPVENDLIKHIHSLSSSYLVKAMAIQNRVYLSEEKLQTAYIVEKYSTGNKTWNIKEYLLFHIAGKMHIFYDACGLKKHFCEPENIRELISYIEFLKSLHTVKWDVQGKEQHEEYIKQQLEYYDQNYMHFCQDIIERMAFKILQFKQHDIFLQIRKRGLERRAGYVIQWYKNSMLNKRASRAIEEMEHFDFGEFLGCIYNWGRDDYEYKELVHCLIASFTADMTREYFNYRYNAKDKESAEHSKRRLEGYMGDNISGEWLFEEMGNILFYGKIQDEVLNQVPGKYLAIDKDRDLQNFKLEYWIEDKAGKNSENHYINIINEFTKLKILPIFECIFLCFNNYKGTKGGTRCTPEIEIVNKQEPSIRGKEQRNKKIKLEFKISGARYVDLDILGFVKKSMNYHEWRKTIGNQLIEVLKKQALEISGYKIDLEKSNSRVEKAISNFENTSLFAEGQYNEMALPIYNLDLSYNLFKRVRRNCQREFSIPVGINDVHKRILSIYDSIEAELEKEEDAYNKFKQSEKQFKYRDIFARDPYIKTFRELATNESTQSDLLMQLYMIYLGRGKIDSEEMTGFNMDMSN